MSLFRKVEVTTVELPNALEFSITREDGLFEQIVAPCLAALVLWIFWKTGSTWVRLITGFAGVTTVLAFVANLLQGRETMLRVTSDELFAEGNLGRLLLTSVGIPAADISSIYFDTGGEGDGWSSTRVLPGLSREQAVAIIDAIARKFPQLATSNGPTSFLYNSDPLTSLGLSDSKDKSQGH
jgi:hypothetical protein